MVVTRAERAAPRRIEARRRRARRVYVVVKRRWRGCSCVALV